MKDLIFIFIVKMKGVILILCMIIASLAHFRHEKKHHLRERNTCEA